MASHLDFSLVLTLLFAAAVVLQWLLRVWLVSRQVRHVAQHRGAVPAAFAHRISLAAHQKAADYTLAKARVSLIDITLSAVVLLGWTLLGGLNALNLWLYDRLDVGLWQQLALLASFAVISALIELPLSLYQTFKLEQRFGFNQMTLGLWLGDLLKSTLVGAIIGLPLAALILWLMGTTGPLWWLWAWGTWTVFNLLLMWIFPSFIAPLFNKFEPLADENLKARVTGLMQRCGFAAKGLFVMDGSRRSAHANAYFTGFGNSKRVVFFDTLLKQLSPDEVEAVLAHELGHFKHKHITKRMVMMFMLAVPVFSFFITPLMSSMSRRDEFEADAYAMQQADGAQLASALLKLYEDNASTLTPDPWYVSFYYSHPPAVDRLARMPAATGSL